FRNEITPGNFTYRMREFEQMEMQFFIEPSENKKWFDFWKEERMKWYLSLGMKKENLRFRDHKKEELAHYARDGVDIEYKFPFGWNELEGIHDRGDWDLSNHAKHSGKDLSFIPHIIETSAGADRSALAFLIESYQEEEKRVYLNLAPALAPYKAAVFPLLANKPALVEKAREVYEMLKVNSQQSMVNGFMVAWDDRGNIGKRYYSQDEIGTPFCITVDFQTLEDNTVTIRDRNTMKQERVKINELISYLAGKLI
ncbi:MAG: glycine--tRNA ligase, partial [bacterium]|nr:glycine--tRNA ligase [bacterium]